MIPEQHDYIHIITNDGSHTVAHKDDRINYHSNYGAIQESKHIFINQGLNHYLHSHSNKKSIDILEIGFGTGLNAILTLLETETTAINVHYTALEPNPLPYTFIQLLNHSSILDLKKNNKAFYHSWFRHSLEGNAQFAKHNFSLNLICANYLAYKFENQYDVIYYDAFGPGAAPDLWDNRALKKASKLLKPEGIFISFCAKGQVKRDLKSNGLLIESPAGPPGKREITRATKIKITNIR